MGPEKLRFNKSQGNISWLIPQTWEFKRECGLAGNIRICEGVERFSFEIKNNFGFI